MLVGTNSIHKRPVVCAPGGAIWGWINTFSRSMERGRSRGTRRQASLPGPLGPLRHMLYCGKKQMMSLLAPTTRWGKPSDRATPLSHWHPVHGRCAHGRHTCPRWTGAECSFRRDVLVGAADRRTASLEAALSGVWLVRSAGETASISHSIGRVRAMRQLPGGVRSGEGALAGNRPHVEWPFDAEPRQRAVHHRSEALPPSNDGVASGSAAEVLRLLDL